MVKKMDNSFEENNSINIRGARQHNLKNIDLSLPRNKFIVFTGVSGSGKSSLAFDTIFAEGQRRYVESLSAYARQFLGQVDKPDVDNIEGLSPAISIDQKSTSHNPRSTVGTVTEIQDYLRLLFGRAGEPHCHHCGIPIAPQTIDEMVDQILLLPEGTRYQLLAPVVRGKKGTHTKLISGLAAEGFARIRINGEVRELADSIELDKNQIHNIEVVVDRLIARDGIQERLNDSLQTCLKRGDGLAIVEVVPKKGENLPSNLEREKLYSENYACPVHGSIVEELSPRLFSFNSPFGACEECEGIGIKLNVDPNLVIPNEKKSIAEGAIEPWAKTTTLYYAQTLASLAKHYGFSLDEKWKKLPKKVKDIILYGSDEDEIKFNYDDGYEKYSYKKTFEGVINNLERRFLESDSEWKREAIAEYQSDTACEACNGDRLKEEALCVKINDFNISEVTNKSILDAAEWFKNLENNLDKRQFKIAEHVLKEINERLNFLLNVGLDYLTLSRESGTLSGGEAQRIRLASQIGSGLTGVLYVLDEPSIGLHQKDNVKLINALKRLRDLGNTVIVVEHDIETMENADHIIDLGPLIQLIL